MKADRKRKQKSEGRTGSSRLRFFIAREGPPSPPCFRPACPRKASRSGSREVRLVMVKTSLWGTSGNGRRTPRRPTGRNRRCGMPQWGPCSWRPCSWKERRIRGGKEGRWFVNSYLPAEAFHHLPEPKRWRSTPRPSRHSATRSLWALEAAFRASAVRLCAKAAASAVTGRMASVRPGETAGSSPLHRRSGIFRTGRRPMSAWPPGRMRRDSSRGP